MISINISYNKNKMRFVNILNSKKRIVIFVLVTILLVVVLLAVIFVLIPGLALKNSVDKVNSDIKIVQNDKSQKNLIGIYIEIPIIQNDVTKLHANLQAFSWINVFPKVGGYYQNADHALYAASDLLKAGSIVLKSGLPVGDLLGYKTSLTSTNGATTTNGSSKFQAIIEILPSLIPSIDSSKPYIDDAYTQMKKINTNYLPSTYHGYNLKIYITNPF